MLIGATGTLFRSPLLCWSEDAELDGDVAEGYGTDEAEIKKVQPKKSAAVAINKTPSKELLHRHRLVLLFGKVNNAMASEVISNLLYLDSVSSEPIILLINSTGGVVTDGMAIYDAMQSISSPVQTVCIGKAYSMGSTILAGGEKGYRTATPHARVMIHEASGGASQMKVGLGWSEGRDFVGRGR